MTPWCPCLASASETNGARNAFSFFDSRVCVDKKFGRAQRQGLGTLAQRIKPGMPGNLGGEQHLLRFCGCYGHVVGRPARIDSPGDRGIDQFVKCGWHHTCAGDHIEDVLGCLENEHII